MLNTETICNIVPHFFVVFFFNIKSIFIKSSIDIYNIMILKCICIADRFMEGIVWL